MSVLELSRWQFGITTVYHFLFVPITIGLGFLVAGFETAWLRTGHDRWLRLAKFYGRLFLINFAMGVVTGIVQEFQFGMNWSAYSRFVGDIFGAPLAIEALLAFFLESTFLGLWIFGWDRLPRRVHAACMWIAATGTLLSAYFILAANSWMQHPVGYHYNPGTHREELTSFLAVMTNPAQLATFPHTVAACFLTAGGLVTGVAMWHLMRRPGDGENSAAETTAAFRSAAKAGAITTLAATVVTGDIQGKLMTMYQPMKMAAAEALYHTGQPSAAARAAIRHPGIRPHRPLGVRRPGRAARRRPRPARRAPGRGDRAERLGQDHARHGDAELADALRCARLSDWVAGLPGGLDTEVGEHGARLSGGQRQRLALARVLLADFPVVILDEPAEHLDEQTVGALTSDLLAATAGRTVLLITHRPVARSKVDQVLRIADGRLEPALN